MPVTNLFDGHSRTWVVDGILKWAPGGNATRSNFKLQGEWFRRTESGTLTHDAGGAALAGDYGASQSGWYVQGVYQFTPEGRLILKSARSDEHWSVTWEHY